MAEEKKNEEEPHRCSREDCKTPPLPPGTSIPPGWSVARVEEFKKNKVAVYYIYACPCCVFGVAEKQESLFGNEVST
jgi:hypothetical protein